MRADRKINWNDLDLSTPEKVHEFALAVEKGGRRAVARAIADHKAAGNPIYFRDPAHPAILIKELPDGRRFQIEITEAGEETIVNPLPV